MIVTKIEIQKNNDDRVNIYLDDRFYCGMSLEIVMKQNLKVGSDIDTAKLDNLILDDEKYKATEKAVKYISNNVKTTKQIKDYLKKKNYSEITINYVLEKLKEYEYINDENYAKSFILTYSKKYGRLKLKSLLIQKGISELIINSLLEEVKSDNLELVATKYLKNKEINSNTYVKLSRFLYSRGYDFDEINSFINRLKGR